MKIYFFICFVIVNSNFAQILRWTPYFATDQDSLSITYDATQGNGGLAGYSGDVYCHTGVITNLSGNPSDWKYVKTQWGQNTPETKLTRIGIDLYQFKIKPTIRSFYGVPSNETILKVAFVFRSSSSPFLEGKTADGGDIFLPLAQPGLNVGIISPDQIGTIKNINDTIKIEAVSTQSNNLFLYVDNNLIGQTTNTSLIVNYIASSYGKKWIKAVATNSSGGNKSDSTYIFVRPPITIQNLPAGILDGINYNTNITSATLSLFAPEKEFVYVLGDFNNWQVDDNYYMKKTPDGKRFWLEINNLNPGTEYAFQYYVDGKIKIADPYADKLLDPWNDKYISSTTYPNLKQYPAGKTTQIVSVLQTAQNQYQWQITNFQKPKKTDLIIYELLIRDFLSTHDYKTLADTIGYLKKLGINAIELMPIMEFEGNESWGYNPSFYFAPDKYYGPKNELKKFIDKAHQNGIAVILDVVLNHSFGQSPLVRLYWDAPNNRPAANNPWFNVVSPNPVYYWGYDFNHEKQDTKDFVDRVLKYWITEYKADGFRFDFSKGFTNTPGEGSNYDQARINILKRIADKMWLTDSTSFVILEHFTENSEEIVLSNYGMMLWGNLNYNYNEAAMGWHDNGKSDFSRISYQKRGWNFPHLVGYMESHDEERIMYKNLQYGNSNGNYNIKHLPVALNRMKLANAFFLTVPGPKMIWQFGEIGYDVSIDYPCRICNKPIKWEYFSEPARNKLYKVFSYLNNLKINYDAFESGNYNLSFASPLKYFKIYHPSMDVLVVGNFDVVTSSISPVFSQTGKWYDYFENDSITISNVNQSLTLSAGEFHIYTTKKLPAVESGILNEINAKDDLTINEFHLSQNFPNPFSSNEGSSGNPSTKIQYTIASSQFVSLKVFDVLGKEVTTLVNEQKNAGVYSIDFSPKNFESSSKIKFGSGVYFYKLQAGNFTAVKKMIYLK